MKSDCEKNFEQFMKDLNDYRKEHPSETGRSMTFNRCPLIYGEDGFNVCFPNAPWSCERSKKEGRCWRMFIPWEKDIITIESPEIKNPFYDLWNKSKKEDK